MSRKVREYIDIADVHSLDQLIDRLQKVRASLPQPAEAEVRMRGDDHFGRRLTVTYARPQTAEEAEHEARCADAFREARERSRREADRANRDERTAGLGAGRHGRSRGPRRAAPPRPHPQLDAPARRGGRGAGRRGLRARPAARTPAGDVADVPRLGARRGRAVHSAGPSLVAARLLHWRRGSGAEAPSAPGPPPTSSLSAARGRKGWPPR